MADQGEKCSLWLSERAPKRKPNWTDTEQVIMLDLYGKYKEVLASRENTIVNCRQKAECWVSITDQLNQVNRTVERSVEEVKRKWHNLIGQGRRDFFDWKRAQQDPARPPMTMPAISRKALELHWNFKFEDWKNKTENFRPSDCSSQDDSELIYIDASDAEMCDIEQPSEQLFSTDIALERTSPSTSSCIVKRECPSPLSVDASIGSSASSAKVTLLPHLSSTTTSRTSRGTVSTHSQDPAPQLAPMIQVWNTPPATSTYLNKNHISTISQGPNYAPDIQIQQDLGTLASSNLNHISLASLNPTPITMATVYPKVSSCVDPLSLPAASSVLSQGASCPPEPARKKFRGSETVQTERETELRIDILQLEKDKLWLETEKLRLEIDILRKQKRQMENNF